MEVVNEAPVQSISVDVTALNVLNSSGNKRKRCEGLKPVLRGSLKKSGNGKLVWSGCWGLTKDSYKPEFPSNVKKAPFYFERKRLASKSSNDDITADGYFQGYFSMQDLSKPSAKTVTFAKYHERNILLRFTKLNCKNSKCRYAVVGSGENKFGKFLIEGEFDSTTGEINVCRNYLPKVKKICVSSPKPRSPSLVTPRRSVRDRVPTLKMKESYIKMETPKTPKVFDFVGREELISLLNEALEKLNSSSKHAEILQSMKKQLEEKNVKSLRSAKIRISNVMDRLPMSSWLVDLRKRVSAVSSRRRVHRSKKEVSSDEEREPKGDYVSVFESLEDVEELDPLTFDPAAELPKTMSSPKLVELSGCFEIEEEEEGDESIQKELYPIEVLEKVDFSDLSYLDAETLKQLNEFVEFSCPSKGQ